MKRIIYPTLLLSAAIALAQSFSAFAADNPDDTKNAKKGAPAAKGPPTAVHASKQVVHTPATVQHAPVNTVNHTNTANTKQTFEKHTTTNPQTVNPQVVQQNKTRNVHANTTATNNTTVVSGASHGQYTRANNYGGRWTAGDTHTDWNHNDEHDWNGHHYRWYDGGWLIIDGGFWPVPGPVVYQGGGSMIAGAQQQLANAGYYNGPIDGVAGPGTRQAIANYQSANNLPVTGHLNEPTRQSLGLE